MALTHRTSLAPRRPPRERALTPPPEYPACAPAFQHKSAQRHARGRDALITDVHKECFSSRYTPKCSLQATHASKTSLFPPPPPHFSPEEARSRRDAPIHPTQEAALGRWSSGGLLGIDFPSSHSSCRGFLPCGLGLGMSVTHSAPSLWQPFGSGVEAWLIFQVPSKPSRSVILQPLCFLL